MVSAGEIVLEIICPVAGGIMAFFMFAAPLRDVYRAVQVGDMGDLNPLPWSFMLGNCYGWVTYGVLLTNYYVFFANMPGFFMSIWLNLQAVKLQYQGHYAKNLRSSIVTALQDEESRSQLLSIPKTQPPTNSRATNTGDDKTGDDNHATVDYSDNNDFARNIWSALTQRTISSPPPISQDVSVLAVVFVWAIITCVITFGHSFSRDTRQSILGFAVNLNLIFFYGAPLSTIWTVLSTRSSSSIHVPTMLMITANGSFWFAYGFAVWDLFILVPNGLGAMLGVVQILLRVTFPTKSKDSDSSSNESKNSGSISKEPKDELSALEQEGGESQSTAS